MIRSIESLQPLFKYNAIKERGGGNAKSSLSPKGGEILISLILFNFVITWFAILLPTCCGVHSSNKTFNFSLKD